jgi:hypothetical protein
MNLLSIDGLPEWVVRTMQQIGLVKIEDITLSDEWKDKL